MTEQQFDEHQGRVKPKRNKFGAIKAESDGIKFDSKDEEKRYHQLKLLERVGQIRNLEVHPKWDLAGKGIAIKIRSNRYPDGKQCVYTADFKYLEIETNEVVVEDVKGTYTKDAKLRIAVFEALYGFRVHIIVKGEGVL